MSKFSLETLKRIYDDKTGDYLEIGPEPSIPELLEIRSYATNPLTKEIVLSSRIAIDPESLDLVIEALSSYRKVH